MHTRTKANIGLCALAILAAISTTSGAHPGSSGDWKPVQLPGHPEAALQLYQHDPGTNGWIGYVVDLGGVVPNGAAYTLSLKPGSGVGLPQLYATFYTGLGSGTTCTQADFHGDGNGGETGTVAGCASGARYAVVALYAGPYSTDFSPVAGALAMFKLSWT